MNLRDCIGYILFGIFSVWLLFIETRSVFNPIPNGIELVSIAIKPAPVSHTYYTSKYVNNVCTTKPCYSMKCVHRHSCEFNCADYRSCYE